MLPVARAASKMSTRVLSVRKRTFAQFLSGANSTASTDAGVGGRGIGPSARPRPSAENFPRASPLSPLRRGRSRPRRPLARGDR